MTQKQRKQIGSLAFYIGNTIIALIFVSPLIWMISASLKPEAEIFKGLNSIRLLSRELLHWQIIRKCSAGSICGNLSSTACFM